MNKPFYQTTAIINAIFICSIYSNGVDNIQNFITFTILFTIMVISVFKLEK